jgi:hypothetical protein
MSQYESVEELMGQLAEITARGAYETTHAGMNEVRREASNVMSRLLTVTRITSRGFGEIADALERTPWLNQLLGALCEAQVREPLTECHHIAVLLRNCLQVVIDALDRDPERIHDRVIADQFIVGRRLAQNFTVRFLTTDPSNLRGGIDATAAQRIALLANLAFLQQPEIASIDPLRELHVELLAAGVPDADRIVEDGIEHPLQAR